MIENVLSKLDGVSLIFSKEGNTIVIECSYTNAYPLPAKWVITGSTYLEAIEKLFESLK